MKSVEVVIFGRRFRLRSDDPTHTHKIAEDLSRQLTELSETYDQLDFSRLLLLACFQREDALQAAVLENEELKEELHRMNQMLENIVSF
jgi:cell division protein ZapA (FtsZ GTPase activity inhibitor)